LTHWLSVTLFVVLLSSRTLAQGPVYEGCVDSSGVPVVSVPANIPDIAMARILADGRPAILYNLYVLSWVSAPTRLFFYAHECAHHVLGHLTAALGSDAEHKADCWAIRTLQDSQLVDDTDISAIQLDIARFGRGDWAHLPGPARAIDLRECLNEISGESGGGSDSVHCKTDYDECRDNISRIESCVSEHVESCMDDCQNNYGYPYAVCASQLCNPNRGVNAGWAQSCRQKFAADLAECQTSYKACTKEHQ
jgi:hypothetical protein